MEINTAIDGVEDLIEQDAPGNTIQRNPAQLEQLRRVLEAVPVRFRALATRAAQGETSPRQAIKAKCQECVGYEDATDRISGCTVHRCPLWTYRPYQTKGATP